MGSADSDNAIKRRKDIERKIKGEIEVKFTILSQYKLEINNHSHAFTWSLFWHTVYLFRNIYVFFNSQRKCK